MTKKDLIRIFAFLTILGITFTGTWLIFVIRIDNAWVGILFFIWIFLSCFLIYSMIESLFNKKKSE